MKLLSPVLLCILLLTSCSWVNEHILSRGEYDPAYLQEDSPLDPPGTAAAREAARRKLLKEGSFREGDTPTVLQGKAFLFNRNPDTTEEPSGKMVQTGKAKILACEGLYYFVQVDDGSRGFLRESDLEPPVQLVSTSEIVEPMEQAVPADNIFPAEAPLPLEGNQKLVTNQDGRTVIVVGKKSDRSQEFEARKRALEQGLQQNAASKDSSPKSSPETPAPLPDPADVPLPEPAGGGDF